jgi:hypothetical protein
MSDRIHPDSNAVTFGRCRVAIRRTPQFQVSDGGGKTLSETGALTQPNPRLTHQA